MPNKPQGGHNHGYKATNPRQAQIERIVISLDRLRHQYAREHKDQAARDKHKSSRETATAWLIGVYTVITAVIAIIAISQANISRDSEQRQLRAYVFSDVGLHNVTSDINHLETEPPYIEVVIKNTGLTPAYRAALLGAAVYTKFPSPINIISSNLGTQEIFDIASGTEKHAFVQIANAGRPLDDGQKFALSHKRAIILFIGDIIYYDTFGYLWCTPFFYYVGGDAGLPNGLAMAVGPSPQPDENCEYLFPGQPIEAPPPRQQQGVR